MLLWKLLATFGSLINNAKTPEKMSNSPPPTSKPNVVFILADDLGWNDVGWHNPEVLTPNLNQLAMSGVILNNSYVMPTCSPSRGALLSGYYPHRIGFEGAKKEKPITFPLKYKLLPEKLKELGYDTHMVGKWHMGFCKWSATPTYRGFDSFFGFYNGGGDHFTHRFERGLDLRENEKPATQYDGQYSTHIFAQKAVKIIEDQDKSRPMFLYLPFQAPHAPMQVPRKYTTPYRHINHWERRLYLGMVTALDEAVGTVVDALARRNMLDNTVIIFSTDNGGPSYAGANNWPLRGAKTTLWEGGSRGPAFVWSKLLKKTSYVNTKLFHITDWYPTIVSLAGGNIEPKMDGVNQWPTLRDDSRSKRDEMVYMMDRTHQRYAIRIGSYKLIQGNPGNYNGWYEPPRSWWQAPWTDKSKIRRTKAFRLYNLRVDPTEKQDLSLRKPHLLKKMKRRLKEHKLQIKRVWSPPKSRKADPANYGGVWSPGWC